jgi:hypothetical protein
MRGIKSGRVEWPTRRPKKQLANGVILFFAHRRDASAQMSYIQTGANCKLQAVFFSIFEIIPVKTTKI